MGLLEQAKADIKQITSDLDGWSVEHVLTTPDDVTSVTVNGLHTKHHLSVDTDGHNVNSKNSHSSFSEEVLTDAGYTVRNANGEVALINHKLTVKDSTGIDKQYVISEAFPDETIGLIVCILRDFE